MGGRGVSLVFSLAGVLVLLAQAAHGQSSPLIVNDAGIGGITAATPFTAEAISSGLGLPVKKATTSAEGVLIPIYEATPDGTMVGSDWASVYAKAAAPDCKAGMEEASGTVICPAPGLQHVSLAFAGKWDGPDGIVPPPEVLAKWTVAMMAWRAD